MKTKIIRISILAFLAFTAVSCRMNTEKLNDEQKDGENDAKTSFFDPTLMDKSKNQREKTASTDHTSPVNTGLVAGGKSGQLLKRYSYTTSYNKDTRTPNWTAWVLTREHTSGPYKRIGYKFKEDMEVPAPRATNNDYMRSGYDRGHMCPSGDNKWSKEAQGDTFYYTNACPQRQKLDAGDWNDLEQTCRHWANKYGKVYIVCGPIYLNQEHRRIGKNKVVVPEQFFKVVMTHGKNGSEPKAIGFIFDNKSGHHALSYYAMTVDEVEKRTGFDFFPFLDDKTENNVEASADITDW